MKINFSTNLTPASLQEYAVNIGWDDCSTLVEGVFYYQTASGSACLTINENGTGEYSGQRSILFSHSIFSRLAKAWIAGDLEVTEMESKDADIPAFVYFGDCYMLDLRDEALQKALAPLAPHGCSDEYFTEWVKRAFKVREMSVAVAIDDEATCTISTAITAGLKRAYRSWLSR